MFSLGSSDSPSSGQRKPPTFGSHRKALAVLGTDDPGPPPTSNSTSRLPHSNTNNQSDYFSNQDSVSPGLRPLRWGPLMAGPSIMTTRNTRGRHPLPLFALEQVGRTQVNPSNSITPGTAGDLLRPAPRLSVVKAPGPAAANFGRNYRVSLAKSIPDQGTRKTIQTMAAYMANIPNLGPLTKRERVREPTQTDLGISQTSIRTSRHLNTSRDHRHLLYPVK